MSVTVKLCPLYPVMANCYIVKNEKDEFLLVDPGAFGKRLEQALEQQGVRELKYILLTHGHFDHILGAKALRSKLGGKIVIHREDDICLRDADESRATLIGMAFSPCQSDITVKDGELLPFGDEEIRVIHTPGHTVGGVCYRIGDHLFTGDTLFNMTVGRTDFPGGSMKQLSSSLEKLSEIKENCRVYPGHGDLTTLDYEKAYNPYMKGI